MPTRYEVLRDRLYNPQHSDLSIICQGNNEFKVDRVAVALHSPILESMITETKEVGGQTVARIELSDIDFNIVYMMLQFFYGGNYNDYETCGSLHAPSHVIYMNDEEVSACLDTLPCLYGSNTEGIPDCDAIQESDSRGHEDGDEEEDRSSCYDDDTSDSERSQKLEEEDENKDRQDNKVIRTFEGHNLFDSLRVYCVASRYKILHLKLLARDRFYRTAEKVLMFSPGIGDGVAWRTHDHQRIYRASLAKAVFDDFPRVVQELYETVPESDTVMRSIPPMLIAAGYNCNDFRDRVKPLLEQYPGLALAVAECMRVPHSRD
ncbi:hypothetical protein F4802DRAFT_620500 [Xylaria palmicola]|nr:hypothetical protein F4802DRAFT_620500 [Xylaria palmicola]